MTIKLQPLIQSKCLSECLALAKIAKDQGALGQTAKEKDGLGNLALHELAQYPLKHSEYELFSEILDILCEVDYDDFSNCDGKTPHELAKTNESFDQATKRRFLPIRSTDTGLGGMFDNVITGVFASEISKLASGGITTQSFSKNLRSIFIDRFVDLGPKLGGKFPDARRKRLANDIHKHVVDVLLGESGSPRKKARSESTDGISQLSDAVSTAASLANQSTQATEERNSASSDAVQTNMLSKPNEGGNAVSSSVVLHQNSDSYRRQVFICETVPRMKKSKDCLFIIENEEEQGEKCTFGIVQALGGNDQDWGSFQRTGKLTVKHWARNAVESGNAGFRFSFYWPVVYALNLDRSYNFDAPYTVSPDEVDAFIENNILTHAWHIEEVDLLQQDP
ncbi:MAG: hypothetical protein SGARI_001009 [Bacillariaceae sp.]